MKVRMTDGFGATAYIRELARGVEDRDGIEHEAAEFPDHQRDLYRLSRKQLGAALRKADAIYVIPAAIREPISQVLEHSIVRGMWRGSMFDAAKSIVILDEVPTQTRTGVDVLGQFIQLDGSDVFLTTFKEYGGRFVPSSEKVGVLDEAVHSESDTAGLLLAIDRGVLRTVKAKRKRVYFVAVT